MSDSSAAPAPVQVVDLSPKAPQVQEAPKAPEAEQKPKQEDRMAAKFAALSRKSKELSERENKWKSESETIKAEAEKAKQEAQQYRDKYGRFASLEESIKKDKSEGIKFLLSQGLSIEDLSDALLAEMNPSEEVKLKRSTSEIEKRLMEKIEALEGKLTAKEQAELEAKKKAEQDHFEKTVTQVKSELKEFIDSSDKYELIKLSGEHDTVFEVMQEHYNDQVSRGVPADEIKLLSYEEAADFTEAYLEDDANKKYEAKRAKQALQTKPSEKKSIAPTLSNTLSTEVPSQVENKPKTREESLARAARLLKFVEE